MCVSLKHVRIHICTFMSVHFCPCVCVWSRSIRGLLFMRQPTFYCMCWAGQRRLCLRLLKFQHWCQVSLPAACSDDASDVSAVTVTVCTAVCVCVSVYVSALCVLYFIAEKCNHKTFKGSPCPPPQCQPPSLAVQCRAISKGKSAALWLH